MEPSESEICNVDGVLSLDETVVHVRCPQCGFQHEHDVPPVGEGKSRDLVDLGDMKLPDLGLHRSRCTDGPRVMYRVLQVGWLNPDNRVQACETDLKRAKAVRLRERREDRTQFRQRPSGLNVDLS